jgi:hypothetical protein
MGDGAKAPQSHQARQAGDLSQEATANLWDKYRGGLPAKCPNDDWPLALSVDASSAYRFVCTHCGTSSPWFEAGQSGIQVRNNPPPVDPDYDGD